MTTSLTTRNETVTSVTTQEGTISVLTTKHSTLSPLYEGTTVFVTSREGTSSSLVRTQQGPVSAFITTQVSTTTAQHHTHGLVAIVGEDISLPCSSPVETRFRWHHRPFGSDVWSIIYNGARITSNNQLASKMTASDCNVRKCTLQVHELRLGATGTFSCKKNDGNNYWSLTVLGKYT